MITPSLLAFSLRSAVGASSKAASFSVTATRSASGAANINDALKKAEEGESFRDLTTQPVSALQGIGPKHSQGLESLGIKTVQQLADYKLFHLARSVAVLSNTEEAGGRPDDSKMNISRGIDKEFQSLYLSDLAGMPVHVLKGIAPDTGGKALQTMGVKTVADLAEFKYCRWAEAIVAAAKFEDESR